MKNTLLATLLALSLPAYAGTAPSSVPPPPSPAAPSSTISYDFIEAGWVRTQDDSLGLDLDGYNVSIAKSICPTTFVFGSIGQSFESISSGGASLDVEILSAAVGVGAHFAVSSNIDWVIAVGASYDEASLDLNFPGILSASATGDTWGAVGYTGFRASLASWLELNLLYAPKYYDVADEFVHAGIASIIIREVLAPKLDVVISGRVADDEESLFAGLRYNFN